MEKFECVLGGVKNMGGLFDVLFVIDVDYEVIVIKEVKNFGIFVIGIVDINFNLDNVDYVILGNDDVICVVILYVFVMVDVIFVGKEYV